MTRQPHRPTTRRVVSYSRTNQAGQDADRDLAHQYRLCQAIAEHFGTLTGHFYDIGVDGRYDQARASSIAMAGGPPSRNGGWAELTAELTSPNPAIDMILLADYDRLPRQPSRREPLLEAAERQGCPIVAARELSTLDRDAGLDEVLAAARTDPRVVARFLRGIGDGR